MEGPAVEAVEVRAEFQKRIRHMREGLALSGPRMPRLDEDLIPMVAQEDVLLAEITGQIFVEIEPRFGGWECTQPELQSMGRRHHVRDGPSRREWIDHMSPRRCGDPGYQGVANAWNRFAETG